MGAVLTAFDALKERERVIVGMLIGKDAVNQGAELDVGGRGVTLSSDGAGSGALERQRADACKTGSHCGGYRD